MHLSNITKWIPLSLIDSKTKVISLRNKLVDKTNTRNDKRVQTNSKLKAFPVIHKWKMLSKHISPLRGRSTYFLVTHSAPVIQFLAPAIPSATRAPQLRGRTPETARRHLHVGHSKNLPPSLNESTHVSRDLACALLLTYATDSALCA